MIGIFGIFFTTCSLVHLKALKKPLTISQTYCHQKLIFCITVTFLEMYLNGNNKMSDTVFK